MKMLRIGYCNPSRHFLYILLTTIMTYMMPSNRSETFLLNYFLLSTLTEKVRFNDTSRRETREILLLLAHRFPRKIEFHLRLLRTMADLVGFGVSCHRSTFLYTS